MASDTKVYPMAYSENEYGRKVMETIPLRRGGSCMLCGVPNYKQPSMFDGDPEAEREPAMVMSLIFHLSANASTSLTICAGCLVSLRALCDETFFAIEAGKMPTTGS